MVNSILRIALIPRFTSGSRAMTIYLLEAEAGWRQQVNDFK